MRRVVLFRFHTIDDCDIRSRVRFLRILNPDVEIHGMYGGEIGLFNEVFKTLADLFQTLVCWDEVDLEIKWRSSDVAYQFWFNKIGQYVHFDVLHAVEWDLAFMDSLTRIFAGVPKKALGCTGLIPLQYIQSSWYWTADGGMRKEWHDFFSTSTSAVPYLVEPYAIQGPAITLPRKFLELLQTIVIPRISIDELRIPLFAQIFGIEMVDNGLFDWYNTAAYKYFNCNKQPVKLDYIEEQMKLPNGIRVFHPCPSNTSFSKLYNLI